jgi:hypothetical protein
MPVPTSIFTTTEQVPLMEPGEDGAPRVVLRTLVKQYFSSPTGLYVTYLAPEVAVAVAKAMLKHARQAELNGFVLPPGINLEMPDAEG